MRDVPACAGHMRRFMYYFGFLPEAYASDCQTYLHKGTKYKKGIPTNFSMFVTQAIDVFDRQFLHMQSSQDRAI